MMDPRTMEVRVATSDDPTRPHEIPVGSPVSDENLTRAQRRQQAREDAKAIKKANRQRGRVS